MFIHWGPASLGGGDISWCRKGEERRGDFQFVLDPQIPAEIYDNFYKDFSPELYDPSEWVSIAQSAGMRYMVLTAKHHDGFCLFDTRMTEHRLTAPDCPCQRDIIGELATACHEAGMRFGLYYSAREMMTAYTSPCPRTPRTSMTPSSPSARIGAMPGLADPRRAPSGCPYLFLW